MSAPKICSLFLFAAGLAAQTTTVFPAEYAGVAEGPFNSPNLPLAHGVSRVQVVYDRLDLDIPNGAQITHLGFRQDATLAAMDVGRTLQLEVRMGFTANSTTAPSTTFADNYTAAPVTVFGPAVLQLPNLRDPANPLPNGQFFLPLTTAFAYVPGNQNLVVEYRVIGNSGGGTSFNYRLDRADFHSPVTNGAPGCQHSGGGTAQLTLSPVRIGQSLSVSLASGPSNSFGVIAVQPGARLVAPFALDTLVPGIASTCRGQLGLGALSTLSATTSSTGALTASYSIPNDPALNDLFLPHQAILFDFFAPGGLVVSNGAEVQVGIRPRAAVIAAQGPPNTVTTGTLNANYCPVSFFRYQ